jgi:hypothetical protein
LAGRFVGRQALLFLLVAPLLGAAIARGAASIQQFFSPLVIFPLLVGGCLGLLLIGLMRLGQIGHRATLWSGVSLAVAVAVAGQHYFSFLDWNAAEISGRQQGHSLAELLVLQEMKPEESVSFAQYMQLQASAGRPLTATYTLRGLAAWASWFADGLLTLLAAGTLFYLACRAPYCSTCCSWYRPIRCGSLSSAQTGQIAAAGFLPPEYSADDARFSLSQCMGGCSPSRLLMEFGGPQQIVLEIWLAAAQRQRLMCLLDSQPRDLGTN